MAIDFVNFELARYQSRGWPLVSNDLWVELDGNEDVPVSTPTRFYHPTKNLKEDWPEHLKLIHWVEENIYYDTKVSGLLLEITDEMLEEKRNQDEKLHREIYHFDSPAEKEKFIKRERELVTPESYIQSRKCGLILDMLDSPAVNLHGLKNPTQKKEFTDFEERVYKWSPDYGTLTDYRKKEGVLFPKGKDKDIKYDVLREYFFHVPSYPELFISLAQEMNTNRGIWGLKRSGGLDWPFDSPTNDRRPGSTELRRMKEIPIGLQDIVRCNNPFYSGSTDEAASVELVMRDLNNFLMKLEDLLT